MIGIILDTQKNTPLSIADAVIDYEFKKYEQCCEKRIALENIRIIGKALIAFAESQDRIQDSINEMMKGGDKE